MAYSGVNSWPARGGRPLFVLKDCYSLLLSCFDALFFVLFLDFFVIIIVFIRIIIVVSSFGSCSSRAVLLLCYGDGGIHYGISGSGDNDDRFNEGEIKAKEKGGGSWNVVAVQRLRRKI